VSFPSRGLIFLKLRLDPWIVLNALPLVRQNPRRSKSPLRTIVTSAGAQTLQLGNSLPFPVPYFLFRREQDKRPQLEVPLGPKEWFQFMVLFGLTRQTLNANSHNYTIRHNFNFNLN
jgi:hypothetical protein